MSPADTPKPQPAPAKPPEEKKPSPPQSPDWGTLGALILALFILIIVVGNATGFGDSQNRPLPNSSFEQTD